MKTEDALILGGAGLLALYLYKNRKPDSPTPEPKPDAVLAALYERDPSNPYVDPRDLDRASRLTGESLWTEPVYAEPTTIVTNMGLGGTEQVIENPTWGDVYWWGGP